MVAGTMDGQLNCGVQQSRINCCCSYFVRPKYIRQCVLITGSQLKMIN